MYWSLKFVERKGIRITGKQKHCCQPVMVMWDIIFFWPTWKGMAKIL